MSLFTDTTALALIKRLVTGIPFLNELSLPDDDLRSAVYEAERAVAHQLRVLLEPTEVFAYPPTDDEIAALATGKPWLEEPAYDYDPHGFRADRWGFIALRQQWVTRVDSVVFQYPGQPLRWEVPHDWIRIDKKPGSLQFVPTGSFAGAPFAAWLLNVMGNASTVPQMIRIRYAAGLQNALTEWPDLVGAIRLAALVRLSGTAMPGASGSLSVDGLSESSSIDVSKYQDRLDVLLFGGKGSNGGLYAALHGIMATFLG